MIAGPEAGASEAQYVPGELVVFFADAGSPALGVDARASNPAVQSVLARYGARSARALFGPRSRIREAYVLRFPDGAPLDAIAPALERVPGVRSVSKNWVLEPDMDPDDYYYNHDVNSDGRLDQWVFQRTQLDRAWDAGCTDAGRVLI